MGIGDGISKPLDSGMGIGDEFILNASYKPKEITLHLTL